MLHHVLTNGVLWRKIYGVCVEELEEGPVDGVGELIDLNHLFHIFIPVGLKHGSEVFTSGEENVMEHKRQVSTGHEQT